MALARSHSCIEALFCFKGTAPTEIYTLSLHDALPISLRLRSSSRTPAAIRRPPCWRCCRSHNRSEEHTSELQSHVNLVCRLLLEKKKILDSFFHLHSVTERLRHLIHLRHMPEILCRCF